MSANQAFRSYEEDEAAANVRKICKVLSHPPRAGILDYSA